MMQHIRRLWTPLLTSALDFIYPPRCAGCGRIDAVWCPRCQAASPVEVRIRALSPLSGSAATGVHEGRLQAAVQSLKYENNRALAGPLAERLVHVLTRLNWMIDTLVPVPLHTTRQRERGYNQANEIAQAAAALLDLPCAPHAIARLRATRSQVGLTRQQRAQNVQAAFRADAAQLAGRGVLIVDDVMTTGSTLQACAQAAIDAGAPHVYSLTVTEARL